MLEGFFFLPPLSGSNPEISGLSFLGGIPELVPEGSQLLTVTSISKLCLRLSAVTPEGGLSESHGSPTTGITYLGHSSS